ncbi:uncharacterized protein LOC115740970 [Rhodamnia argentea]|uniref:Uncharacterized protein LOC115740970 n=1 Tax=Rhodamnia argentea TaxID=178133 RepID=A0ABM3HBE1_9MYRT|nr:uncharacterized protein LOC115740970 [Rhodamnia argentea]
MSTSTRTLAQPLHCLALFADERRRRDRPHGSPARGAHGEWRESKRSLSSLLLAHPIVVPRSKGLDPLERACLPAVISSQLQIKGLVLHALTFYIFGNGNDYAALNSVDQCLGLLQSIPQDVLDKGKAAAEPSRIPGDMDIQISSESYRLGYWEFLSVMVFRCTILNEIHIMADER